MSIFASRFPVAPGHLVLYILILFFIPTVLGGNQHMTHASRSRCAQVISQLSYLTLHGS